MTLLKKYKKAKNGLTLFCVETSACPHSHQFFNHPIYSLTSLDVVVITLHTHTRIYTTQNEKKEEM